MKQHEVNREVKRYLRDIAGLNPELDITMNRTRDGHVKYFCDGSLLCKLRDSRHGKTHFGFLASVQAQIRRNLKKIEKEVELPCYV